MQTIAIIGAGFSGTMTAVHLLRNGCGQPTRIMLVERTGRFSAGVAYGTAFSSHLLNVPAGRMSAFESEPDHFLNWAQRPDRTIAGGTFVQRRLYGQYLADVLDEAQANAQPATTLQRCPGQAIALARTAAGQFTVLLDHGQTLDADSVVLAIGNFPPANPPVDDQRFYSSNVYARDPWKTDALNVRSDQAVLLLGTGLTMLDVALALRDSGHSGTIHAISRRGLMPQPHRLSATPPPSHERPDDLDHWPRTTRGLCRALRNEVRLGAQRGVDWREVVTSIRHDTPALWQSLSTQERRRFLRHVRPFWETHRHRAAPMIAHQVQRMIESHQLQVMPARVLGYSLEGDAAALRIRRRGAEAEQSLNVARIINCTGPDTDLARVDEPLIANLRDQGLIRPDALGLGLDSTDDGAIINAQGKPCQRLWLVGPLRKGRLWENTAVPELRIEAERLANHLAARAASTIAVSVRAGDYAMQC